MTPSANQLSFISFFAGIGGFEVGFQRAGIKCIAQVEKDPACQELLKERFPGLTLKGDICDVTGEDFRHLARARILVGGFPCNDTSIAAPHRAGLAGKRSGHYYQFTRLIDEYGRNVEDLDPRFVVIENPTGLLKSGRGFDMARAVHVLEDLGYGWAYRVVDPTRLPGRLAGPQRRARVLLVGHRGGDPRPAGQVLGLLGAGGEAPAKGDDRRPEPRPGARPIPQGASLIRVWRKGANPQVNIKFGYEGGYRETWVNDGTARTLTGFDWGGPTRQTHLISQHGRLRAPTPVEWERLQGFPDGWTEGMRPSDYRKDKVLIRAGRGTALGNAMHVGMAQWLGTRLAAVDAQLPQLEVA